MSVRGGWLGGKGEGEGEGEGEGGEVEGLEEEEGTVEAGVREGGSMDAAFIAWSRVWWRVLRRSVPIPIRMKTRRDEVSALASSHNEDDVTHT